MSTPVATHLKKAHKCRANNPRTCRYHGTLLRMEDALKTGDYSAYNAAKEEFEQLQTKSEKPVTTVTEKPEIVGDVQSAKISRDYGHFSIFHNHMHNGSAIGSTQEIIYYSSPQGQLELQRRLGGGRDRDYLEIQEIIKTIDPADPPQFVISDDVVAEKVAEGKKKLDEYAVDPAATMRSEVRDDVNVRHFLVEESSKWLSTLSTEQQESISWLTSNGFGMVQYAIGVRTDYDNITFKSIVDMDAIYDKHSDYKVAEKEIAATREKYASNYLKTVRSSFKNAPKFEKPVILSRGTSFDEVRDILGGSQELSSDLMSRLEQGSFTGQSVAKTSRMSKIPLSATASPIRARSFTKRLWDGDNAERRDVLVVVKAKSSTSPVNVGAWGSGEVEVLTNPLKDYTISGGRRVGDDLFVLELEEAD